MSIEEYITVLTTLAGKLSDIMIKNGYKDEKVFPMFGAKHPILLSVTFQELHDEIKADRIYRDVVAAYLKDNPVIEIVLTAQKRFLESVLLKNPEFAIKKIGDFTFLEMLEEITKLGK